MRKEMTVVDKLQRTFNNLPQEKKDRINRILENYEETVFSTPHEPNNEDRLEQEITTLREQVEKLTKERNAFQDQCIRLKNDRAIEKGQLAALAEQNEKMRSFFEFAWKDIPMSEYAFEILEHVMNLPNLADPALNRIRAVGMRMAAQFIEDKYDFLGEEITVADEILAKADELSKGETR